MYKCFALHVYKGTWHVPSAQGGQTRASEPLKLELDHVYSTKYGFPLMFKLKSNRKLVGYFL